MQRFGSQPAYILHSRPYRETSVLMEVLTRDHGRISVIAKGVRAPKARLRGLLQPFVPLLIDCVGRGELLTLTACDSAGVFAFLGGRRLVSAFYLNELLFRLLHRFDPHPELFHHYQRAMEGLAGDQEEQLILRKFEKSLLKVLGYELQLVKEAGSGIEIDPEKEYFFDPELGPVLAEDQREMNNTKHLHSVYKGRSLLALAAETFTDLALLGDAKRLMRRALAHHLGQKPLQSRRLL